MKFNILKLRGFKGARIWAVIGVVLVIGVTLMFLAFFQSPTDGGGVTDFSQKESVVVDTPQRQSTDSDINGILYAEQQKSKESILIDTPSNNSTDSVPSILGTNNKRVGVDNELDNNQGADPTADELAKQLQQIKNQQKVEKLNDHYAAFSSKINVYDGKSRDASSPVSAPTTSNTEGVDGNGKSLQPAANKANDANTVYSSARIQRPFSPYELKAGSIINCVLQTRIVSQLNGLVVCLVSENTYDTVNGRYLLVPQGAKLIGKYSNNVPIGDDRLAVAFTRIIYPNGNSITLEGIPASDSTGANGISDEVDNHYWQLFGSSFILGVIKYSGSLAANDQTAAGSSGQEVTSSAENVMQQKINVSPTITIREGYPISIIIDKDLILEPYKE